MKHFLAVFAVLLVIAGSGAWAGAVKPRAPASTDKCPVCGMFVAKYPDFISAVIFKDGSFAFFDGTKDLCKYFFNMKKYNPTKTVKHIAAIFVTDYYRVVPIDGYRAYYVVGSDVYGPMGKELIPFQERDDAQEFMKDHRGKAVLRFTELHPDVVRGLD